MCVIQWSQHSLYKSQTQWAMIKGFPLCKDLAKYDILSSDQNLSTDMLIYLPKQTWVVWSLHWEEMYLLMMNIYGTMPTFNFSSQLYTVYYNL